ncbi:MAG TPA: hypothetical protein VK875_11415 [Euzebyales bacterium]|nr:hypothetical protein [Euzebyales bacterium]
MTSTATHRPAPATTERVGYVVAVLISAAVLFAVNVWPGWQIVPFLTDDLTQVLGLINVSLVASIASNLVFLTTRASWVRPLGDLVTTGIGIAVMARMLRVFPFAFDGASFDWAALVRVVLIVGLVGAAIAVVVQFVTLVRAINNEVVSAGDGR